MTIPRKRHRVSNLRLAEISTVDRPAQVGAVSVLIKSAGDSDMIQVDIRKNAAAVAHGEKPMFTNEQFEDAMFARADELAQQYNISPEQALAKNLATDPELRDLAHASEIARYNAYAAQVR